MITNGDRIIGMARVLVSELETESPLYQAILEGEVSEEGYVEFLVQHFKYIRISHDMMHSYADSLARSDRKTHRTIHAGAKNHAHEEDGHEIGVLADLGALWGCSIDEALARVEATPTAPAVELYLASVSRTLERFPVGIAGLAAVLESVAWAMAARAKANLLEKRPFPGVERALRFLSDHSEDEHHVEGGRMRIDLVEDAYDACAIRTLASAVRTFYREMYRFMDMRLAGRTIAEDLLVGA